MKTIETKQTSRGTVSIMQNGSFFITAEVIDNSKAVHYGRYFKTIDVLKKNSIIWKQS